MLEPVRLKEAAAQDQSPVPRGLLDRRALCVVQKQGYNEGVSVNESVPKDFSNPEEKLAEKLSNLAFEERVNLLLTISHSPVISKTVTSPAIAAIINSLPPHIIETVVVQLARVNPSLLKIFRPAIETMPSSIRREIAARSLFCDHQSLEHATTSGLPELFDRRLLSRDNDDVVESVHCSWRNFAGSFGNSDPSLWMFSDMTRRRAAIQLVISQIFHESPSYSPTDVDNVALSRAALSRTVGLSTETLRLLTPGTRSTGDIYELTLEAQRIAPDQMFASFTKLHNANTATELRECIARIHQLVHLIGGCD